MNVAARARRLAAPVGRPLRRARSGCGRGTGRRTRASSSSRRRRSGCSPTRRGSSPGRPRALGVELGPRSWARGVANQSIFHLSQFTLLLHDFERRGNNLGLRVLPRAAGTPGMPEFDACFETMRARHAEIDRIQVTNREMEALVLVDRASRRRRCTASRSASTSTCFRSARRRRRGAPRARALGLPASAFVVGSFQKDGVGWGEGLEPKLIKGPDVLLAVAERLARARARAPRSCSPGPARGYVRAGLERLGIPYRHLLLPDVDAVAEVYRAIDVCLVASRDEGGPRAVLESMATRRAARDDASRAGGRPRARTARTAGWSSVEDVDGLVELDAATSPRRATGELERVLDRRARATAEDSSYDALAAALASAARRLRGASGAVMDVERCAAVGRGTAARPRAGRGSLVGGTARPGVRVFYGHDRVPGPGEPVAGGTAKLAEARRALARTARPTSRSSTSARPSSRATSDRSSRLARRRGAPIVVNQDGVGYPGWAGERTDELNRPLRARAARGRPRPLPERVLQALLRRVPRRAARRRGRSSRTPSTSTASRRRTPPAGRPGRSCSAATRRRRTGSSSRLETFAARPATRTRTRGSSSPAGSSPTPSRARAALGARSERSTSSGATRSATRPTSSGARTSSCTRR